MRLGPTQLDWDDRVRRKAGELGFTCYHQVQSSHRPYAPSLLLVKNNRMIAVWLRTGRKRGDRQPDPTVVPAGVEAYVWYPEDWPSAMARLMIEPVRDDS